jgi:hypothetical protein
MVLSASCREPREKMSPVSGVTRKFSSACGARYVGSHRRVKGCAVDAAVELEGPATSDSTRVIGRCSSLAVVATCVDASAALTPAVAVGTAEVPEVGAIRNDGCRGVLNPGEDTEETPLLAPRQPLVPPIAGVS